MKVIICIAVFLIAICVLSCVRCSRRIKTVGYSIKLRGLTRTVRTVMIADMHNKEYGRENSELLALIREQKPERIFACGDIIGRNAKEAEISRMLRFLRECSNIAPVYFVRGNHETGLIFSDYPDLLDRIAQFCTVVNDSSAELEIGNVRAVLGGTKGTFGYLDEPDGQSYAMLSEMIAGGLPMIVMSHKPDAVISSEAAKTSGALFLSGHTHGGLWRLPLIGGLIAPGQGLLPKYDMGLFEFENNTRLIVSSGLYGYSFVPRMFNLPELTVIDFIPE